MPDHRPPEDPPTGPGSPDEEGRSGSSGNEGPYCEEIQHAQISAVVPERVARGVFSTGAVVVQGPHEFILDFLLRMSQPQQVAARVVLPPGVVMQFIAALSDNLKNYESKYSMPLVPNPQTGAGPPVSAQELYEQLKLQDDVLSGNYANAVMIGHTPSEFCFDFITTFYPRSAVSCRVFMAAPGVPRLLESLKHSFEKFQQKLAQHGNLPPRPPAPPEPKEPE
jgi:Protein of unknown function (DUF3467)